MTSFSFDGFKGLVSDLYGAPPTALHRPVFEGNELSYLQECIATNFVSSAGKAVGEFEDRFAQFVGAKHAVATVNGTAALHAALLVSGVKRGDEVISQALTFVATCNALSYVGAHPVFIDVGRDTLGLCPDALQRWLESNARVDDGTCYNKATGARIAACVPMHSFGLPCRITEIASICKTFGLTLIEDAAEALGSYERTRHAGTIGHLGTFSFNGNKVITTGGGGMITTDDPDIARRVKHLVTTAKVAHAYEFVHDMVGYNYRMPNLNAALGIAQMEKLSAFLEIKAKIASVYRERCADIGFTYFDAPKDTTPNYWLNTVLVKERAERDDLLEQSNAIGIMTRPVWTPMHKLKPFLHFQTDGLDNTEWLADRIVNIPSSIPESEFHRL